MDADKRCFSYCGDDKCDCPARGFDRSLEQRIVVLEFDVQLLRARERRHHLETMRFGGHSQAAHCPEFPEPITDAARRRQARDGIGP